MLIRVVFALSGFVVEVPRRSGEHALRMRSPACSGAGPPCHHMHETPPQTAMQPHEPPLHPSLPPTHTHAIAITRNKRFATLAARRLRGREDPLQRPQARQGDALHRALRGPAQHEQGAAAAAIRL